MNSRSTSLHIDYWHLVIVMPAPHCLPSRLVLVMDEICMVGLVGLSIGWAEVEVGEEHLGF